MRRKFKVLKANGVTRIMIPEGYIDIVEPGKDGIPSRPTIKHYEIKEEFRRRGLSQVLLGAAKRRYDFLGALALNEYSIRALYKAGFRFLEYPKMSAKKYLDKFGDHDADMIWRRKK